MASGRDRLALGGRGGLPGRRDGDDLGGFRLRGSGGFGLGGALRSTDELGKFQAFLSATLVPPNVFAESPFAGFFENYGQLSGLPVRRVL